MNGFLHGVLKLLSFLSGIGFGACAAYLAYLKHAEWGWFLGVSLIILIATMIWCGNTEK